MPCAAVDGIWCEPFRRPIMRNAARNLQTLPATKANSTEPLSWCISVPAQPTTRKGNPNPIVMTRNVVVPTSNQMRDYLLCDECERRFSEHGENSIARQVYDGTSFPLLDRLNVAVPLFMQRRVFKSSAEPTWALTLAGWLIFL